MKKIFKTIGEILLSTVILFLILEIVFRFVGAPGGSKFVEKVVIEEGLTRKKPKSEFRIFTYGESTMQGAHYGPTSSPAKWLGAYLEDYLPDENIRVVNFARVGHGSDFTYETFKQTLFYKPDLAIFYLGHNDFTFGNRKDHIKAKKETLKSRFREWIRKSYLLSTISRWVIKKRMVAKKRIIDDRIEFDVIETPPRGIGSENSTPRTEPFFEENINFYKQNIQKIIKLGKKKNVPVIFYKPVSNIKDFAPFQSVHMKKLTNAELSEWQTFYEAGKEAQKRRWADKAIKAYLSAYEIDNTFADLSFRLGQLYLKKGELTKARYYFSEARDNDSIIFRAPKEITDALEELKETEGLELIDLEGVLRAETLGGIMGEPIIEDNCHLSLRGHALAAKQGANYIARKGHIVPYKDWRFERERPYEEMAAAIGIGEDLMFEAGLKMVNYFGSRYDNRLRFANKALKIKPDNPRALRYLAWTYWLMGEKDKAAEVYRKLQAVDSEAFDEVMRAQPEIAKKLK